MATGDDLKLGQWNTADVVTDVNLTPPTSAGACAFRGTAGNKPGVMGESQRIGIWGISRASGDRTDTGLFNVGVRGSGDATIGVHGMSTSAVGVLGTSHTYIGAVGSSIHDAGVYGHSDRWTGVVGSTGNPRSNFAGFFWGPVGIEGPLTVVGKKSAAVPHPDGSLRLLYAVESPESWFEDFGVARLVRGRARVLLDRDFAAVVRLADYHVFLSPEGDSRGLYVGRKTARGFEVREGGGGTSTLRFSFRIVARRKDVRADRFEKFELPRRPRLPKVKGEPAPPAPGKAKAKRRR